MSGKVSGGAGKPRFRLEPKHITSLRDSGETTSWLIINQRELLWTIIIDVKIFSYSLSHF